MITEENLICWNNYELDSGCLLKFNLSFGRFTNQVSTTVFLQFVVLETMVVMVW